MENKKIAWAKLKNKIKNTEKKVWVAFGVIGGFVLLALILIVVSIYTSGSSLGEFFSHNWGWFMLGVLVVIIIILSVVYYKVRKVK